MFAAITFSGLNWLVPAGIIVGVAFLVVFWSYSAGTHRFRWLCIPLKAIGIAALAICLLEPLWTGQRAKPGANLFALVADNSAGLQIKDRGDSQSRGENLKRLLEPQSGDWQEALTDNFELRRFSFDSHLNATRDFGELDFNGRASAIGAALRGVGERFQGRPLAGVLLFTDGNATDIKAALPKLTGLPPIYPVVIGKPGGAQDIAIGQVNVTQTVFEDAPVSAQVNVGVMGLSERNVTAQLIDATGKKLEEQNLRARSDNETLPFRFQWRPEKFGLSFYRVRVGLSDEIQRLTNSTSAQEATLVNNSSVIAVDRGRGPYRILYVSGRPNWEFKYLNRAEQEDDQVQLVGLIRVALREPKFSFRGRAGETSNPLYRGFGNQSAEDIERYDQPVLIRLNTKDEVELRNGFPRKAEDLYEYQAVIIDDLEAAFFSPDQATLLQKFVSERGGGFLMLGGMESFREGQYQRTPIGEMLPVYLDRGEALPSEQVKLNLSREGWLQTWARLRNNESDERQRLLEMPAFQVLNPAREVKPGASVIATAADEKGKEYPALATQRFGRGRTAALLIGDVWRWGMQNPEARKDMEKSWRQLVRWLISDVPKRVELAVERSGEEAVAGEVKLQVRVRDEKFQPLDDATVFVDIEPTLSDATASTNKIRLRAEPSLSEAGVYEAAYVPRETGGYRASATVTNTMGITVGQAEAGWSADQAADEFRSLQPNTALLEMIAKSTGGEVITASKLNDFVKTLPNRRSPVMEPWTAPAWHTPALFAFALACLAGEWGLRRWKGMP